jgi:hypothetical protein
MATVKAYATMYSFLEWVGEIPDEIEPDDRQQWIKDNVCGGSYENVGGDWSYDLAPHVVDEGESA